MDIIIVASKPNKTNTDFTTSTKYVHFAYFLKFFKRSPLFYGYLFTKNIIFMMALNENVLKPY